jgi:hypothetical protein
MEMASLVDILVGVVLAGGAWWAGTMAKEVKRLEILLNKTREDYATKFELRDDMDKVMQALHRLEDKLDRALQKD